MKKYSIRHFILFLMIAFLGTSFTDDTEVCPGRGERCAYVKILGIKIWQKKEKGGPGLIVKSE